MSQHIFSYQKGRLYDLNLDKVHPDQEKSCTVIDRQAMEPLQAPVAAEGVLQPILVREGDDGSFIIVSGEQRFHAAKSAGSPSISAILTSGETLEVALIEKLLRGNLTPSEEIETIESLQMLFGNRTEN